MQNYIERKLYSKSVISLVDEIINEYPNAEESFILSMIGLPLWLVKLMSFKWQREYISKLPKLKAIIIARISVIK